MTFKSRASSRLPDRIFRWSVWVLVLGLICALSIAGIQLAKRTSQDDNLANQTEAQNNLVVLGTAGLSWPQLNITEAEYPNLYLRAIQGAIANNVRSQTGAAQCLADAWLSLSAGSWYVNSKVDSSGSTSNTPVCSDIPDPLTTQVADTGENSQNSGENTQADASENSSIVEEENTQSSGLLSWDQTWLAGFRQLNADTKVLSPLGTLSKTLQVHNRSFQGIGIGAALALTQTDGTIPSWQPLATDSATLSNQVALSAQENNVTIVDLTTPVPDPNSEETDDLSLGTSTQATGGQSAPAPESLEANPLPSSSTKEGESADASWEDNPGAESAADTGPDHSEATLQNIEAILNRLPSSTSVILLDLADTSVTPQLGASLIYSKNMGSGLLKSGSLRRAGLVQSVDITQQILSLTNLSILQDADGGLMWSKTTYSKPHWFYSTPEEMRQAYQQNYQIALEAVQASALATGIIANLRPWATGLFLALLVLLILAWFGFALAYRHTRNQTRQMRLRAAQMALLRGGALLGIGLGWSAAFMRQIRKETIVGQPTLSFALGSENGRYLTLPLGYCIIMGLALGGYLLVCLLGSKLLKLLSPQAARLWGNKLPLLIGLGIFLFELLKILLSGHFEAADTLLGPLGAMPHVTQGLSLSLFTLIFLGALAFELLVVLPLLRNPSPPSNLAACLFCATFSGYLAWHIGHPAGGTFPLGAAVLVWVTTVLVAGIRNRLKTSPGSENLLVDPGRSTGQPKTQIWKPLGFATGIALLVYALFVEADALGSGRTYTGAALQSYLEHTPNHLRFTWGAFFSFDVNQWQIFSLLTALVLALICLVAGGKWAGVSLSFCSSKAKAEGKQTRPWIFPAWRQGIGIGGKILGSCGLLATIILILATSCTGIFLPNAGRASATSLEGGDGPLVVIGTSGLRWGDLLSSYAPQLRARAEDGVTFNLVTRALRSNTCPTDGWLSLSGAGRAADAPLGSARLCRPLVQPTGNQVPRWGVYLEQRDDSSYDTDLGLLGETLAASGKKIAAIGSGAAIAIANRTGEISGDYTQAPRQNSALASLVSQRATTNDITIVDAGALRPYQDRQELRQAMAADQDLTAFRAFNTTYPPSVCEARSVLDLYPELSITDLYPQTLPNDFETADCSGYQENSWLSSLLSADGFKACEIFGTCNDTSQLGNDIGSGDKGEPAEETDSGETGQTAGAQLLKVDQLPLNDQPKQVERQLFVNREDTTEAENVYSSEADAIDTTSTQDQTESGSSVYVFADDTPLQSQERLLYNERKKLIATEVSRIEAILEQLPENATVMIVSLGDQAARPNMQMGLISGPLIKAGKGYSASVRQKGIAQLSDLSGTIVSLAGIETSSTSLGSAIQVTPSSESTFAQKVLNLIDRADQAVQIRSIQSDATRVLIILTIGISALLGAALSWGASNRTRFLVRAGCLVAAATPSSLYTASLYHWWSGTALQRIFLFAISVAILQAAGCYLFASILKRFFPQIRRSNVQVTYLSVVTLIIICLDVWRGSPLAADNPLGIQTLVGGRYYGVSNSAFALLAVASILAASGVGGGVARRLKLIVPIFKLTLSASQNTGTAPSLMGEKLSRKHRKQTWRPILVATAVLLVGLIGLAFDGYPTLGADFGGPPALLPGLLVALALLLGIKISIRRIVLASALTVTLVGGFCFLDYLRPAAQRSHLGKLVESVLSGELGQIIVRKLSRNLNILFSSQLTVMLIICMLIMWAVAGYSLRNYRQLPQSCTPGAAIRERTGSRLSHSTDLAPSKIKPLPAARRSNTDSCSKAAFRPQASRSISRTEKIKARLQQRIGQLKAFLYLHWGYLSRLPAERVVLQRDNLSFWAGTWGVFTCGAIGFALNDSGVAIPALMMMLFIPLWGVILLAEQDEFGALTPGL